VPERKAIPNFLSLFFVISIEKTNLSCKILTVSYIFLFIPQRKRWN